MDMDMEMVIESLQMLPSEAALLKARGYQIGAFLGRGIGGTVYRGTCKGKPIAVKAIEMNSLNCQKAAMEVLLLKLVSHPNVVQYLDLAYLLSSTSLLIFMEYMAGGDLEHYLRQSSTHLTDASAGKLFRQIVEALTYMHAHGFAHRDLKSANILLDQSHKVAKIGDFGTGFVVMNSPTGRQAMSRNCGGALEYRSPEALQIAIYDYDFMGQVKDSHPMISPFQADVWSMGVILYEMLHKKLPFETRSTTVDGPSIGWFPIDPLKQIRMLFNLQQKEVPFKETLSPMAKGLVKKLLAFDPKDRPQMADILKDEWLTWAVNQGPEVNLLGYLKRACSIS